jgi:dTDP-4-dehydrorhamnose reductase
MATVMVVGANGFLGSNIVEGLKNEHKVIALFRKEIMRFKGVSHFTYGIEDRDYLKRLMQILKPDFVIYAAGMNDFMECHLKEKVAEAVNTLGPVVFMGAAETISTRFIFISNSYVFDGSKGSYVEDDVVMADTTMGKTRLGGENYVRNKAQIYTILRCSPVLGIGSYSHTSLFDKMRIALSRGERFELPENEIHSFLSAETLLNAINWIIKNESANETYHLGGLTKLSTFEFGQDLAKSLGLDAKLIIPTRGTFQNKDFLDFSLDSSKFVTNSQIDTLVLEQCLDLFQQKLIC